MKSITFANISNADEYIEQSYQTEKLQFDNWLLKRVKNLQPDHMEIMGYNDKLIICARLNDCNPDDIKITLNSNRLTICARLMQSIDCSQDDNQEDNRHKGHFRVIDLPCNVYMNQASAQFKNNLLVIKLKKAPDPKSIVLKVQSLNSQDLLTC